MSKHVIRVHLLTLLNFSLGSGARRTNKCHAHQGTYPPRQIVSDSLPEVRVATYILLHIALDLCGANHVVASSILRFQTASACSMSGTKAVSQCSVCALTSNKAFRHFAAILVRPPSEIAAVMPTSISQTQAPSHTGLQ